MLKKKLTLDETRRIHMPPYVRKAMPKNVQITAQLYSFYMLAK